MRLRLPRLSRRAIASIVVLSPVLAAAACGSSSNPISGNSDSGTPSPEAGPTTAADSSPPTTTTTDGATDATIASGDAATSEDAGPQDDGALLGLNCPVIDAGTFVEGPHGPLPTVVYSGGGILEAPQVITFTFPTTLGVATLQSFGATITKTPWFADVTKDYCINGGATCIKAGADGVSIPLTGAAAALYVDMFGQGAAPAGSVDLEAFINEQIAAAVTAKTIPAPGANSLYAFYFPPASEISMGPPSGGSVSCQAFGGYHNSMLYSDNKTQIVYAIMPDCPSGDPAADLQYVTIAASHEIIEATTDPYVGGNTLGWYLDQDFSEDAGLTPAQIRNDPWATADSFGEVGDNCESLVDVTWTLDSGVEVQRIWSPTAAALGHNPCIPVPAGESYYNSSTDKVLYVADVGSSFMVDISVFSDMARSPWRLDALDWTPTGATMAGGLPLQYLSFEFVGGVVGSDGVPSLLCVNNNSTGQVKVTLLADPTTDSTLQQEWPEADGVILSADVNAAFTVPEDGGSYTSFPYQVWPFAVVTPATAATLGVGDAGVVDATQLAKLRTRHHAQPYRGTDRVRIVRPKLVP